MATADASEYSIVDANHLWGSKPDVSGPNRRPITIRVETGELVRRVPEEEQIPRGVDEGPRHNYSRYDDPSVTFYSDGSNLSSLRGSEHCYLEAVVDLSLRCREYRERDKRLSWIMELKNDDGVLFKLPSVTGNDTSTRPTIKGRIRFVGKKSTAHCGILFGIEIEVRVHVHLHSCIVCTVR